MARRVFALVIAAFMVALSTGCSTMADARNAKGTGVAKEYPAAFDTVWAAMPGLLTEISLPMAGENKQEGYILAQRGMSMLSSGENVAIFLSPVPGQARTRVEVVSKKALATEVFATNWTGRIHDKLGERFK